jgi:hypothetical protein
VFVTGLIIAILGSTGEQLGLTLWKLAENRIQKRRDDRRKQADLNFDGKNHASLIDRPESLVVPLYESEVEVVRTHKDGTKETASSQTAPSGSDHSSKLKQSQCHSSCSNTSEQEKNILTNCANDSWTHGENHPHRDQGVLSPPSKSVATPGDDVSINCQPTESSSAGAGASKLASLKQWCIEKEAFICVLAFALFAAGNGLNFVALGLIQESIVTLIGAWALVINIVTAKFLLGEELNNLDGVSVLLIIAGIAMSILGSKHKSTKWCGPSPARCSIPERSKRAEHVERGARSLRPATQEHQAAAPRQQQTPIMHDSGRSRLPRLLRSTRVSPVPCPHRSLGIPCSSTSS